MKRVIPKSTDPNMPVMVISSYNRAGNVTTINQDAFSNQIKVILVHNEDQKNKYQNLQDLKDSAGNIVPVLVTNQRAGYPGSGKARQMKWAWDQLDEGEFIIFSDDDIGSATWLKDPYYKLDSVNFDEEGRTQREWSRDFSTKLTPRTYQKVISSTIKKMLEQKTILGGFATNDNFFFRGKHWRRVGYVSGHMMIMQKNSKFSFDLDIAMEDYRNSAEVAEIFGSVVLNNYAYFKHSMYIDGGLGTAEERFPFRGPDCDILMRQYPGFFRIKGTGVMADADLSVAVTDRTLDQWVNEMRALKEFVLAQLAQNS